MVFPLRSTNLICKFVLLLNSSTKMDLDALLLRPDKIVSLRNNLPLNTIYPDLIDLIVEVRPIGN